MSRLQLEIKLSVPRCSSLGIVLGCGICLQKEFRVNPSKISRKSFIYHVVLRVSVATSYGVSQTTMRLSAPVPLEEDTCKSGNLGWHCGNLTH